MPITYTGKGTPWTVLDLSAYQSDGDRGQTTGARKRLGSSYQNMMPRGGSQARQVDRENDEEPWGSSHLGVRGKGRLQALGWTQGRRLSPRTAGRRVSRRERPVLAEAGWGPESCPRPCTSTAQGPPSCPSLALWSLLKSTDPFWWPISLSAHGAYDKSPPNSHTNQSHSQKNLLRSESITEPAHWTSRYYTCLTGRDTDALCWNYDATNLMN